MKNNEYSNLPFWLTFPVAAKIINMNEKLFRSFATEMNNRGIIDLRKFNTSIRISPEDLIRLNDMIKDPAFTTIEFDGHKIEAVNSDSGKGKAHGSDFMKIFQSKIKNHVNINKVRNN